MQRSSFSLTRVTWIFKVTAGAAKYIPAPLIRGWTTHAKRMQPNEGEVKVRSSGTPLTSFWDRKHTNDNFPCLRERPHHLEQDPTLTLLNCSPGRSLFIHRSPTFLVV